MIPQNVVIANIRVPVYILDNNQVEIMKDRLQINIEKCNTLPEIQSLEGNSFFDQINHILNEKTVEPYSNLEKVGKSRERFTFKKHNYHCANSTRKRIKAN
jgi:hypothetical protein